MTFGAQGYALARGEGEGLWFFNGLFTVKAGGPDTREAFTLIEAELPAGEGVRNGKETRREEANHDSCRRTGTGGYEAPAY